MPNLASFLSIFFSTNCLSCGLFVTDFGICKACSHLLRPRVGYQCHLCGALFRASNTNHTCGRCLLRRPHFDQCVGLFEYEGPAGRAIRRGKYGRTPEAIHFITEACKAVLPAHLYNDPPLYIVPTPQHWRRGITRRFDPVLIIARAIAEALEAE